MDITKPHMIKAIKHCLDNNLPLNNQLLTMINSAHEDASNLSLSKKLDDVIYHTEKKLNQLYEITQQHTRLDILRNDLSKHISNLDNFRTFIKENKEINL